MSRIFDALQRSGTEQSGVEYPDMVSVATEVFEAPRRPASPDPATPDPHPALQVSAEPIAAEPISAAVSEELVTLDRVTVTARAVQRMEVPETAAPAAEAPVQESVKEFPANFPRLKFLSRPRAVWCTSPNPTVWPPRNSASWVCGCGNCSKRGN